ncbi:aminotransferase class V-fold PLP-dependent enzyme [Paenibacillus sp. FJAT-26967]|uniref:aminotransferase class V-fold PLP-dependent enzyme n=1 Tax=Paenibacillus sp. FJAT-26967 TaxID=1729690 RepID=UPI000837F975|nr:aminotransferase class V-fold PLP-dependent enzyme [Paenibacillus sp. FJAT-26967]
MSLIYKIASTNSEIEQIHRLNYQTFVDEIPQHEPNAECLRVDRFHDENTYLIGKKGEKLVAMLAIRGQRPFSLDEKLGNVDAYLPFKSKNMVEIRLLAVDKQYRNGSAFYGLAQFLKGYLWDSDVDMAVMSGTTRELKLYRRLGFVPFAHTVGTKEAAFQPMYMTRQSFQGSETAKLFNSPESVSFCAGPVSIEAEVAGWMNRQPVSHRSAHFVEKMTDVQAKLTAMTQSEHVQILLGSGTLANDAVAGQLSRLEGRGLILVNGEFGGRLVDHARRMRLDFDVLEEAYGKPFDTESVEAMLHKSSYSWVWMVHCETSTGMLNDTESVGELCSKYGARLCLDCISSLGAVRLDLRQVYLASGVSGKAIGAYTGLAFVFHQEKITPCSHLPRYLDLGLYADKQSVPFSHSSNLLDALNEALQKYSDSGPYEELMDMSELLYEELARLGLKPLTEQDHAAPLIVTIPLRHPLSSCEIGDELARQGFCLQYESDYLAERNLIQIATIGISRESLLDMTRELEKILGNLRSPSMS